jgi:ubiquinone/menaquinone biosynthesis C-methylase UbiE
METGVNNTALNDLDGAAVDRAYQLWAPVYDVVCGGIFEQARRAAAETARSVGGRILEIGIGTGLSLDHYKDAGVQLHGIDLCAKMLAKAREKARSGRYPHLKQLEVMDAHKLIYPDSYFDCTVAQFVITLVASPEQVLAECARVVRPGGEIILVNHFYSEQGFAAAIERLMARPARKLGLRPEFPLARLEQWAEEDGRAKLIDTRKVGLLGSYTLVRFRRV